MWSEMCSLHLTHPSAHTWSSGQPTVRHPGSSFGVSVPCSRVSPQSWTLSARAGIRTHNPWVTLGFKSNALSIRPRLPLPWQPSCEALFVWRPKSVKTIDSTMRLHWAGTRDISIAFYFLSYCLFPFGFSLYNHFLLCVSKLLFVSMCVWQCSFLGLLINYWRLICYLFKFLINYVWI